MVVTVGDTVVLPLADTLPRLLMVTVEAPVVVQLKVDCCPGWMVSGLASNRTICGVVAGNAVTVTTTV